MENAHLYEYEDEQRKCGIYPVINTKRNAILDAIWKTQVRKLNVVGTEYCSAGLSAVLNGRAQKSGGLSVSEVRLGRAC